MSYDQYISLPAPPDFSFEPPTPISAFQATPAATTPIPISRPATGSRASSRSSTPALSRSNSARHHPYGYSPASFTEQPLPLFRPPSAADVSDRSDWESDFSAASYDFYSSSVGSPYTPASSYDLPVPPPLPPIDSPYVSDNKPRIGKNGKPVKSHSRKTAPGHIKRPPNAFILFRSHCCSTDADSDDPSRPDPPGTQQARALAAYEINKSQHISVIVSQVWRELSSEDKAYWEDRAREAKEEHQRLHPEYRYRPQQRPKEAQRRRRKPDTAESRETREACHAVARRVIETERTATGTPAPDLLVNPRNVVPSGLPEPAGVSLDEAATAEERAFELAPAPKRKPRAKKAVKPKAPKATKAIKTSKAKAIKPSPDGIILLELPDEKATATPTFYDPRSFPTRPHTASDYGDAESLQHNGDFSAAASTGHFARRTSQIRAEVYGSADAVDQFAFMAQLEAHAARLPMASAPSSYAIDPRLASAPSTRPSTAVAHPTFDPSYTFGTLAAPNSTAAVPPHSSVGLSSEVVSPRSAAIERMQSYTLGGPPAVAPEPAIAFTSPFGPAPSAAIPHDPDMPARMGARRDSNFPPHLSLDALRQRRGTLRPGEVSSSGRGDLMLISPHTTTFNGRRTSLGWNASVRRLSVQGDRAPEGGLAPLPAQSFARSSLSAGVISASEQFEAFTFPQEMLANLPVEDPDVTAEFFAQFTQPAPLTGIFGSPDDELSRPSTASSQWSDVEDQRLDFELPAAYLERRRSTIVASKLSPVYSSGAASPSSVPYDSAPQGFHVGSTDFFIPPASALSTAATSAVVSPVLSEAPVGNPSVYGVAAFGSPDCAPSYHPQQHHSVDQLLTATSDKLFDFAPAPSPASSQQPDFTPANEDDWLAASTAAMAVNASATSMRGAALEVLHEHRSRQQGSASPQVPQDFAFGSLPPEAQLPEPPREECSYVFLSAEQLQDAELLAKVQRKITP
ncbi:hypothetical protein Rhopal_004868-T1 [Rhodotorula paludigena]|uniref:HMG box domain-containing protein n=1 Tax=Rhodotorula paludigena TaxID=86838 RepID=A0AAV5GQQ6_9BASI|nr:hypothetical protein Rhopal_004868-T1 [Rhodotorula paludigena]